MCNFDWAVLLLNVVIESYMSLFSLKVRCSVVFSWSYLQIFTTHQMLLFERAILFSAQFDIILKVVLFS